MKRYVNGRGIPHQLLVPPMPPVKPCRKETRFEMISQSKENLAKWVGNYLAERDLLKGGLAIFVGNFGFWLDGEAEDYMK
jgi:hypothetical protein